MKAVTLSSVIGAILLLPALAAGQEPKPKDKPDPAKFALRLEAALLIENAEQKSKSLFSLANDAAELGRTDLVKKCLGALPNENSPMSISQVLLKLIGSGKDADALEIAKGLKDAKMRDQVLANMVDGLAVGTDALWKAAEDGRDDTVTKLLEAGVPLNAKDHNGETALMKAAAKGHVAVVKVLLAKKAELLEADAKGETALMKSVANGHESTFDVFWNHFITSYGTNRSNYKDQLNAADRKGMTVLMKAAEGGHATLVNRLRRTHFKETFSTIAEWIVNDAAKDNEGKTAAQHAEDKGHAKIVELLKTSRGTPPRD